VRERSEFRQRLADLCACGPMARREIDELLGQHCHRQEDDLATFYGQATLEKLYELRDAFDTGLVCRRAYHGGSGRGCMAAVLFGFHSNEDLWNWEVSDSIVAATDRVLRWWDYFEMSDATAIAALRREIAQREAALARLSEQTVTTNAAAPLALAQ
jgi:hypothetical protein